ncbi:MAG: T9SS type A sorting domain-containing protein [Chitinispirillaceae bacterium]|nr:T9SS type A sorting domain-containing protein [Chitinispirillaceae bacterium]
MNGNSLLLIAAASFLFTVASVADDGTWYKPFHAIGSIYETGGAGDFLWFLTGHGIGRLNTVTLQTKHFSFCSLDVPELITWNNYSLAVGDSDHVAFYNTGNHRIFLYDGISWENPPCPYDYDQLTVDYRGRLWVAGAAEIAGYDGNEWKTLPLEIPDSMYVGSMLADDTGAVWFVIRWPSNPPSPQRNSRVYCFDGLEIHPISIDSFPIYTALKDIHGNIWLLDGTGSSNMNVYSIGPDRLITIYQIEEDFPTYSPPHIDSDGNLWSLVFTKYSNVLYKNNIRSLDTTQREGFSTFKMYPHNDLTSCNNGVYLAQPDGFSHFTGNGLEYLFLSKEDLLGTSCENISQGASVLFKKDGSFLSFSDNGHDVIEYKNGNCHFMPSLHKKVSALFETVDGAVLATAGAVYSLGGLYRLQDTTWELLAGTENLPFHSITQDKNGKIWGSDGKKIIRQTDFGWELIDSGNSNLPYLDAFPYTIRNIRKGPNDAIWIQLNSSVAQTNDGFHWTFYDFANPDLSFNRMHLMSNDKNGDIVIWYSEVLADSGSSRLIRAVYNGLNWVLDTVPAPSQVYFSIYYEDVRGDLWAAINYPGPTPLEYAGPLYRYTDSSWIAYDTANTPFLFYFLIGENANGDMYFRDMCNETVVFKREPLKATTPKMHPPLKSGLFLRTSAGNSFSVNYTLPKSGVAMLSLYSLQGRLVRTLLTGFHRFGTHRRTFTVTCSPGLYFVRLRTPEGSHVSQLVLR